MKFMKAKGIKFSNYVLLFFAVGLPILFAIFAIGLSFGLVFLEFFKFCQPLFTGVGLKIIIPTAIAILSYVIQKKMHDWYKTLLYIICGLPAIVIVVAFSVLLYFIISSLSFYSLKIAVIVALLAVTFFIVRFIIINKEFLDFGLFLVAVIDFSLCRQIIIMFVGDKIIFLRYFEIIFGLLIVPVYLAVRYWIKKYHKERG